MNGYPRQMDRPRPVTREERARYTGWLDGWVPMANGWAKGIVDGSDIWFGQMNGYPGQTYGLRVVDGPDIWFGQMNWYPGKQSAGGMCMPSQLRWAEAGFLIEMGQVHPREMDVPDTQVGWMNGCPGQMGGLAGYVYLGNMGGLLRYICRHWESDLKEYYDTRHPVKAIIQ
ncbi:hypothetical protein BDR06DRAFT_976005 [Suillus hirtellus]|nr:hypothetical protein BDR06DRAFT_976005 [Suillus hirtellus]